MKYFIFNLIAICLLLTQFVLGQNQEQKKIIESDVRPTVDELIANGKYLVPFTGHEDSSEKAESVIKGLPHLVVSLEKAFPGGTYAFLGRDMELLADALNAFYLSIGQSHRVVRIPFSTPSLSGITKELVLEFFTQLGLDISQQSDLNITNSLKTFVIIDYTTFNIRGQTHSSMPSQSRYLFESVFDQMKEIGFSEEAILRRINVATINSSPKVSYYDPLNNDIDKIIPKQIENLKKYGEIGLIARITNSYIENAAYDSEWHGKFGPIKRKSNGILATEPISTNSFNEKALVLNQIIDVIKGVSNLDFLSKVNEIANKHAVHFEKRTNLQSSEIYISKLNFDKLLKEKYALLGSQLNPLPVEKDYKKRTENGMSLKLTENGSKVFAILNNSVANQTKHFFEISFVNLVLLFKERKIGARDFRRIMSYILTLRSIENTNFASNVQKFYNDSSLSITPLNIMLGSPKMRKKYLESSSDIGNENYRLLIENGNLPLKCGHIL